MDTAEESVELLCVVNLENEMYGNGIIKKVRRLLFGPAVYQPHHGLATLDMRGRLQIDVKEAIRRGVWREEIKAARELGVILELKRKRRAMHNGLQ